MLKHPPLSGYDVKHETINQSSFLRDHYKSMFKFMTPSFPFSVLRVVVAFKISKFINVDSEVLQIQNFGNCWCIYTLLKIN